LRDLWDSDNPDEVLEELLEGTDLVWAIGTPKVHWAIEEEEGVFVGMDVDNLKDDWTIKENKRWVQKKISKSLGIPEKDLKIEFFKGLY
jgi:hypothetical protein